VTRLAITPLFGPALVLYLIADVASQGRFAVSDYALAAVIVVLSALRRGVPAGALESRAEHSLHALGLSAAVALLRLLSAPMQRLSVEMAEALALGVLGATVLELGVMLPEPLGAQRYRQSMLIGNQLLAAISVILSCLALAPHWYVHGEPWLVPALYAHSAAAYAGLATLGSLALRLARRRWGMAEDARLANSFALLGSLPVLPLLVVLVLPSGLVPAWAVRSTAALAALALAFGHRQLLAAHKPLTISNATRDTCALFASLALVIAAVALWPQAFLPSQPLTRAAWLSVTLLATLLLYRTLADSFRRAFAPDGGRLLAALAETQPALGRAQTLEVLVATVLRGIRGAYRDSVARPLLYGFDPAFEGRGDAAGAAHLTARTLHPALASRLWSRPFDLVIRSELEQQIVRQPANRPLLDVVLEQDLFCAVPLTSEGELEGALLLPLGGRTALLSHEEQRALWEFARHLAGLLAAFSAKARAEQRANDESLAASRARAEIAQLNAVVARLSADRALLQSERAVHTEALPLIAYSARARELVARLRVLANEAGPVTLVGEPGLTVEPFARLLHERGPFIALDCAATRVELLELSLFGGASGLDREVGCLRAAEGGTLLLLDVPALPLAAQTQLARALASGWALSVGAGESYPVGARVVASSRCELPVLASSGRFALELADQLSVAVCRVPPLRECVEDLGSLVLLALDRSCRRQGRGPLGIEPDAQELLAAYDFPGNHVELDHIIDRAVERARGLRLTLADLSAGRVLPTQSGIDEWAVPFEQIERRALTHALARAHGNKSEAARLLGLPRRTLLDKLRRHKLDVRPDPIPRPN
jgi:DNA-binding NtrC family response regulator